MLSSSLHYMMCVRNTTSCNHFYTLIDKRSTENSSHLYSITANVVEYGWLFIFDYLLNISNFINVTHWNTVVWCDEKRKEESGKNWGNTGEYATCFATAVCGDLVIVDCTSWVICSNRAIQCEQNNIWYMVIAPHSKK